MIEKKIFLLFKEARTQTKYINHSRVSVKNSIKTHLPRQIYNPLITVCDNIAVKVGVVYRFLNFDIQFD